MYFAGTDSQALESFESDVSPSTNKIEITFLVADLSNQTKRYDDALLEIISIADF